MKFKWLRSGVLANWTHFNQSIPSDYTHSAESAVTSITVPTWEDNHRSLC